MLILLFTYRASERIQQTIDNPLDEAVAPISRFDWEVVCKPDPWYPATDLRRCSTNISRFIDSYLGDGH